MNFSALVNGIQHVGLPTGDFDGTVRFYTGLGFTVAYSTLNGGSRVAFLSLKNLVIETYESKEAAMRPGAIDHIALDVNDVDAVFAILKEGNYRLLDQKVQYLPFWSHGVRFFTIEGPNSEKIEFSQMLKG